MPEYKEVEVKQIQVDNNLKYHLFNSAENMELPVIMPLIVYYDSQNYKLIDGFKRYTNLNRSGIDKIPVFILDKKELKEAFIEGLLLNNAINLLSIVEQLIALKILHKYFKLSFAEIEELCDNIFQIPVRKKFSGLYEKFFNFSQEIHFYLFQLKPSFKQLQQLLAYPEKILIQLKDLFLILPVKIKDALFILDQMYRLEKKGSGQDAIVIIKELLGKAPFPNLTADKKTDRLKMELQKITFPLVSKNRDELQKLSRELMKQGLKIKFDTNMEKSDISVSFQLKGSEELENINKKLSTGEITNKISNILNILKIG